MSALEISSVCNLMGETDGLPDASADTGLHKSDHYVSS